jgi:uncharacterized protein YndB with AHSA1/START domain
MPYDYTLTALIPASAREIYDAWLDSRAHSEMTSGRASMSNEPGAAFSAWDGYITGRNLKLVPGKRIVQSWRTTKFSEDHEDSIVTVTLDERNDHTMLTLAHSNVPDTHTGYEKGGWQASYFEPMISYFANARSASQARGADLQASPPKSPRAAPAPRPKRPAAKKKSAAPKARSARGATKKQAAAAKARPKRVAARKKTAAKRKAVAPKARGGGAAARTKSKRAAPKAKKAAARKRAKPAVRAKGRPKRAGRSKAKSARGRRR